MARSPRRGFTLVETVVALGALAIFASIGIAAMARLNEWATSTRLQTLANALVQEKVHEALYNPWARPSDTWPVQSGTESGLILNSELGTVGAGPQSVLSVPAERITAVEPLETAPDGTYRLLRITGTVRYSYRGKTYELPFTTMRTCAQF